MTAGVCVYLGDDLARYAFGHDHPFGPDRLTAFRTEFERRGTERSVAKITPVKATLDDLRAFHTADYLELLSAQSARGEGFLDYGDTPAFEGILEASLTVAGSVLDGVRRLMDGRCRRVFVPIAGLHHARRDAAAGFCAVNDCGIAIETLKRDYGLTRIAYVDVDAHHGDGVFYAFEGDERVIVVDFHEDGDYLYPGTGRAHETGRGAAKGLKLNIPLPPGADDTLFFELWPSAAAFLTRLEPEFIVFQSGADSLQGDPITHLRLSSAAHARVATDLCRIADQTAQGRVLALGGGGYNRANLATAWNDVVQSFVDATPDTRCD